MNFNSRPSARGDKHWACCPLHGEKFQFTPLREGRLLPLLFLPLPSPFQFTPLREGRLKSQTFGIEIEIFQFTPLREGRPMPPDGRSRRQTFQFTPLREGRLCGFPTTFALQHFNSRPSARGDMRDNLLFAFLRISIHAPPRGATTYMIPCPDGY